MTMSLRIAQNDDSEEWDRINSQSQQGTIFHTWKWLKIMERHTRMKLFPIIATKKNNPVGIFPFFFQKSGPLRLAFSPPPHATLFYLGPVLIGYEELKQSKKENRYAEFQASVEDFIKNELKANYISISLPPNLRDPRPFTWSGYTPEITYDYVIDLQGRCDPLIQSLTKKQRENLSRARRRGITVELGEKREYETILDLMDERYSQQGKRITTSREYFLDIYDAFRENLKVFVALLDGEVVSGSVDFQYRDVHYSWIGNPKPKHPVAPSPNDLLIGESVRYAKETGCRYYITLGAAGDRRLHSYYVSKFNPELRARFSVKRTSLLTAFMETGYSSLFKPIRGIVNHR